METAQTEVVPSRTLGAASLGMYDFAPLTAANDALWAALRPLLAETGLTWIPAGLDRARELHDIWRDPRLLLAQTCGFPLMTSLAGRPSLVATPCYDLPGCDGPLHRSFVVVRASDPAGDLESTRGRTVAINAPDSNSGMNLLRAMVAPLARSGRFFDAVRFTGGHLASIAAVRTGATDVAAIDCVTHGLLARHDPAQLQGTRIIAETPPVPGLPLISRPDAPPAMLGSLRDALAAVATSPAGAAACGTLALAGFAVLPLSAYRLVIDLAKKAAAFGYDVIA